MGGTRALKVIWTTTPAELGRNGLGPPSSASLQAAASETQVVHRLGVGNIVCPSAERQFSGDEWASGRPWPSDTTNTAIGPCQPEIPPRVGAQSSEMDHTVCASGSEVDEEARLEPPGTLWPGPSQPEQLSTSKIGCRTSSGCSVAVDVAVSLCGGVLAERIPTMSTWL